VGEDSEQTQCTQAFSKGVCWECLYQVSRKSEDIDSEWAMFQAPIAETYEAAADGVAAVR